ncbi:hypothetical protein CK203_087930 [Vitis vinifera]|uniref:Uncharacterized protein n=1 Tax=Vitis vinifera TaxID=29760 RepID=A0A438D7W9_VITVI|nr:hypothetical protein CK203_087930 [Vitis vinifera]
MRSNEHGTFFEIRDIVDELCHVMSNVDEMLTMSLSQIDEIVQFGLASPFDLFGVSVIEITEDILTALALESIEDVLVVDDLFGGPIGPS